MRRLTWRIALLACALIVGAAMAWGPACARGASLVIRAAQIQGFLLSAAKAEAQPYTVEAPTTVPTRHGAIRARLYRPGIRIRRTVLLVPGVHAMGIDEPRLTGLSGELAASGLAVLTMELPDLMKYQFTPRSVDEIEDAISWLSPPARSHARRPHRRDGDQASPAVSRSWPRDVRRSETSRLCALVRRPRQPAAHVEVPLHRHRTKALRRSGRCAAAPSAATRLRRRGHSRQSRGSRRARQSRSRPLREGVVTYLTASQIDMVDKPKAATIFEAARRQAAALPEPAAT